MNKYLKKMNEEANKFYGERRILPYKFRGTIQKSSTGKCMILVHQDIKKDIAIFEYRYPYAYIDSLEQDTRM